MIGFLKQPSHLRFDAAYDIKISIATGLFVFLFLLAFQPFGLSHTRPDIRYYLIVGYSLVCFTVLLINLLLVPRLLKKTFNEENWKVYKRILWQLWIVFCIGAANYLFACLFNHSFDFYWL
jgi:hypothetical protein